MTIDGNPIIFSKVGSSLKMSGPLIKKAMQIYAKRYQFKMVKSFAKPLVQIYEDTSGNTFSLHGTDTVWFDK